MGAISPGHLVLILLIALLVLGPDKLPETGAAIGKAVRDFRDAMEGNEPLGRAAPTVQLGQVAQPVEAAPPDGPMQAGAAQSRPVAQPDGSMQAGAAPSRPVAQPDGSMQAGAAPSRPVAIVAGHPAPKADPIDKGRATIAAHGVDPTDTVQ